jgi:hypothetical protein
VVQEYILATPVDCAGKRLLNSDDPGQLASLWLPHAVAGKLVGLCPDNGHLQTGRTGDGEPCPERDYRLRTISKIKVLELR